MKNYERYLWMALLAALTFLLVLQQCSRPKPYPPVSSIKIDTAWLHRTDTIFSQPKPVVINWPAIKHNSRRYPEPEKPVINPEDYYEFGCSWESIYADTVITSGAQVVINDTISQNLIKGRSVISYGSVPVITKTQIHTVEKRVPVSRTQLYIGLDIAGAPKDPLYGLGGSLMLKTKNDRAITAGATLTRQGWVYQAGYKWKIKLNPFK